MRRTALATALAVLAFSASAHAQTSDDVAAAEVLFTQAKKLIADGRFAEACPKLAESNRLDPGIGTMLYLGDCYEKTGRTASAWGMFKEAEGLAHKTQDGREKLAHNRAAPLEAKLPTLTIGVAQGSRIDGLVVQRDGTVVGAAQWGLQLPVDPGPHSVRATAPGHAPWSMSVSVAEAGSANVDVPPLATESAPAPLLPPSGAESDGRTQRLVAIVVGGVGLAGVGVGAFFGLSAKSKADDAKAHCDGSTCDAEGVPLRDAAKSRADISTVAFIGGGVALAAGVVLYLTAPRARSQPPISASKDGLRVSF